MQNYFIGRLGKQIVTPLMMTNLRMKSLAILLRILRSSLRTIKDFLISLKVNIVHPGKNKKREH